ncbi:MAG: PIN domain-containing protein, partial [Nitrospirota bacterium]
EQTKQKDLIIIPTVVLAELMFISQKGRITITFSETLKKIEESENFNVAPLDIEILKVTDKMKAAIEMHDKLIVATALYFEAALITRDEGIKKLGIVSTVW